MGCSVPSRRNQPSSWYGWQPPLHTHSFPLFSQDYPPPHPHTAESPLHLLSSLGRPRSTFLAAGMENKESSFKGSNVHHFCSRSNFFFNFQLFLLVCELKSQCHQPCKWRFDWFLIVPQSMVVHPSPPLNCSRPLQMWRGGMWSHGRKYITDTSSEPSFLTQTCRQHRWSWSTDLSL